MKISPLNSFLFITAGVLFVPSHITLKLYIPLDDWTSLKKGSIIEIKFNRVNSSLNSNNKFSAAFAIAFSRIMKSLRTLILSKDDGRANMVLSPNKTFPFQEMMLLD